MYMCLCLLAGHAEDAEGVAGRYVKLTTLTRTSATRLPNCGGQNLLANAATASATVHLQLHSREDPPGAEYPAQRYW